MYKIVFFRNTDTFIFDFPAAGLLSRSWPRGTQDARLYTTVQVRDPTGLRGASTGPSNVAKSGK